MFQKSNFEALKQSVVSRLEKQDAHFTYHNLAHALDVMEQAERIAKAEGVDEKDQLLLRLAALYHDLCYPQGSHGHEQRGAELFEQEAAVWDFSAPEIEKVKKLILATKVPQKPTSTLEEIICDADLDYLGREDFLKVGRGLRDEYLHFQVLKNAAEWDVMQVHFLEKHRYFTNSSRKLREPVKQRHLEELKQKQTPHI